MIRIKDKETCCGCEACWQICPRQCISFTTDSEGFKYPKVDKNLCIDCHLCERVCPELNLRDSQDILNICSAISEDEETRAESSSGGVFSALAKKYLQEGGVVFGVAFTDDFESAHTIKIENTDELARLRGSKYFQASTNNSFQEVYQLLKTGRSVLYSGTPCQISALSHFLRVKKCNTEKLLKIDVLCHGVPSPGVWSEYLKSLGKGRNVRMVSFRDKKTFGWKSFCLTVKYHDGFEYSQTLYDDLFMKSFLNNWNLRPSCYSCCANDSRSDSDITLGDYWGAPENIDDDKGLSLVIIRTAKAREIIGRAKLRIKSEVSLQEALRCNHAIKYSFPKPKRRSRFWKYCFKNFPKAIEKATEHESFIQRRKVQTYNALKRFKIIH